MKYLYSIMIAFLFPATGSYAQWTTLSSGTTSDFSGVYFLNADTGFAAGGGSSSPIVILKTTDGGDTWIKVFSATYSDTSVQSLDAITFTSNDTGFVVGEGSNFPLIMITTDGGSTWNKYAGAVPAIREGGDFNSIEFYDNKNGFVTGTNTLYHGMKTTDGGMTWSFMGSASSDYYCIYFKDSKTGYETDAVNGLIKTENGGATWNNVSLPSGVFLERVVFTDNKTIFGVGSNAVNDGAILKSIDTGASWTLTSSGLPGGFTTISFPDPQNGFVAGFSDTIPIIYNTTDSGNTWNKMSIPVTGGFLGDIYFVNKQVGYCVGSGGVILKYTAPTAVKDPESSRSSLVFYPNPTTKYINWNKNISRNNTNVLLYSIDGRLLETRSFKDGVMDVSAIIPGIYILRWGNDAQLIQKE